MFDTIVNQLLNSLPYVFAALLLLSAIAAMVMTTFNRRQKQAAKKRLDDQQKAKKEQRDLQVKLGNEALDRFREAASKNVHCNMMPDGRISQNIGRISVLPMPSNGLGENNSFSLIPYMPDNRNMSERIDIFQLDIGLNKRGKEIHIFDCSSRRDYFYPIEEFDYVTRNLCQTIRAYSVFPQTEILYRAGKLKIASQG